MTDATEETPHVTHAPGEPGMEAMRERLIQAELRAAAREAGMHDLDGLKMLDRSGLVLNDKMELPEAAGRIAQLKRDKPYLFGGGFGGRGNGTVGVPPPSSPARGRNAMDMSLEEWRAARAELLRRR